MCYVWRRRRRKKCPQDEQELASEDGRQPAQPTPPPPVQGAPADDPVNAGDQDIEQQLPEADVHAGAIPDDIHHTRDNSHEPLWRRSVVSNEDVTSVCHMPIEETAPQKESTSYPRPTQVEDKSGGAQFTVRGMRRLSMTSEAAPTLVRDGQPTEVRIVLYPTIYIYVCYSIILKCARVSKLTSSIALCMYTVQVHVREPPNPAMQEDSHDGQ